MRVLFQFSGDGDLYEYFGDEYDYHYNEIDRIDRHDYAIWPSEREIDRSGSGQKVNSDILNCEATSTFKAQIGMTQWCNENCNHVPRNCPESMCVCRNTLSGISNELEITRKHLICKPAKLYKYVPGMSKWCDDNCNGILKFCPETVCMCM